MASISSVSGSSNTSSLYNSANIISGLASGLDTESMIENLVKAYQTKITQLQQKSTKIEWKQDAYRSIISKMYAFSNNYTSYTSSNNMLSQSFFNSAKTYVAQGANASKVSATGTSSSEIVLNSIDRLAQTARYSTSGNFDAGDGKTITASSAVDLTGRTEISSLQGSMTLTYGNKTVSLYFSEDDIVKPEDGETNAQALARVIEDKLKGEEIVVGDKTYAASEKIKVSVDANGEIAFYEKGSAGNSVYISGASDDLSKMLNLPDLSNAKEDKPSGFTLPGGTQTYPGYFKTYTDNLSSVSNKTMNINLDGTTKQIKTPLVTRNSLGNYQIGGGYDKYGNRVDYEVVKSDDLDGINREYVNALNKSLEKEFGKKIKVENIAPENYDGKKTGLQLQFTVPDDSDILINTDAGDVLGIGKTASNYLNTNQTLEEVMGDKLKNLTPTKDSDGNFIEGKYDFEINGVKVGSYDKDTTIAKIMSDINSSEAGVKVTYSKTSREFVFTTKETGEQAEIDLGTGLASAMFGPGKAVNTSQKTATVLGDGETLQGKTFDITIDGKGYSFNFNSNTGTLQNILNKINDNNHLGADGYKMSIADDGSLLVKDKDGKAGDYTFGPRDGVAQKLQEKLQEKQKLTDGQDGYTKGQDAQFNVTVNGATKTLTRSTNKVEIDGMTMNLKGTFNEGYADAWTQYKNDGNKNAFDAAVAGKESVTFQKDIQADDVVSAVKNMIAEYNVMVSEIRAAYTTMPAKDSSGALKTYDPLTDEERASMSESSIQAYEEKAKQGLLFADSNLSNLYQGLTQIFNRSGQDATTLKNMGIGISYDTNNAATITFDEKKFRQALEDDFDGVVDIFTRTAGTEGGTDGIMQAMKTQLDKYGATTGSVKGILVQQAGTPLASLSLLDNGWQKEIDNLSNQITKWQDKLSDQVDRYTQQFARLESLINQMNQQSSQLAGLMGQS
ncbi:MAG: flagellar filament capping protein FliD [Oscillospiraceae bacterium]|nr:flagellar filament capping protein FliD [Oscillospiraceae bacterium]